MIRVFPVCTGMNRPINQRRPVSAGVPRMHGDEPTMKKCLVN